MVTCHVTGQLYVSSSGSAYVSPPGATLGGRHERLGRRRRVRAADVRVRSAAHRLFADELGSNNWTALLGGDLELSMCMTLSSFVAAFGVR